jgi:hypothetical protein
MASSVLPSLHQQTAQRFRAIERMQADEKPAENLYSRRFLQSIDMSELQAALRVIEEMNEEEYEQAHQDEEDLIRGYEAQCVIDELDMDQADWQEFWQPVELGLPDE